MKNTLHGIEKLVFKLGINEYVSEYNYDGEILTVGGKSENKIVNDYLLMRNNTIANMLSKNASIIMTVNGEEVELPKVEIANVFNYRPQARLKGNGNFNGIQGVNKQNNTLILGGNIVHHIIFWDVTLDEANKRLNTLVDSFPEYEFKLVKC